MFSTSMVLEPKRAENPHSLHTLFNVKYIHLSMRHASIVPVAPSVASLMY